MTSITLELDKELQAKLENYASKHGQSLPESATNLINMGFEIVEDFEFDSEESDTEEERLFYNPKNVKAILEAKRQLDEGKKVLVTVEELRAMIK